MWTYNYTYQRELYHHGILGQKWGKRNGPPYPLGTSAHSSSEKKADWRKSLDKTKKSEYNDVKYFNKTLFGQQQTREYKQFVRELVKIYDGCKTGKSKKFKKLTHEMSIEEHVKAVNPDYSYGKCSPWDTNCANCTIAYEMRRRGYDIKAAGNTIGMTTEHITNQFFKGRNKDTSFKISGSSLEKGSTKEIITKALLNKYPEGARGSIGFVLTSHLGHVFNWEINKGKIIFTDGQIGKIVDENSSYFLNDATKNQVENVTFVRLDNLKPNVDQIRTICVNSDDSPTIGTFDPTLLNGKRFL